MTQALHGVIFFAVTPFDLSTSSGLKVALDALEIFLAVLFLGFFMIYRTVESFGEAGQGKV